jgi:uncharacterized protein YggE
MRLRLLVLTLVPLSMQAQVVQAFRDSVITVTASRNSRIVADRASLYVVIEGTAETAPDAVARVETKLKAVSAALKGFGSRLEVDAPIAYAVGATPLPNGFPGVASPASNIARSVIRVQLIRPAEVANVVAAALSAGAASSSALTFESSVADSARRARIAEALAAARMDAEAIAQALGAHLGALVDVSTTGGNPGFQGQNTLSFDNRFTQQAMPPEIAINTSVTVRYRLIH